MKLIRCITLLTCVLLIAGLLCSHSYTAISVYAQESATSSNSIQESAPSNHDTNNKKSARNNFDLASLLSLLGIGLLKFIDDKLKIKLKDKTKVYKKILITSTILFTAFDLIILICYFGKLGSSSFGNLRNGILGIIPVVFCVLTLITHKVENNNVILSQKDLEKRINDFTAAGMAPLGMIVGDMDFLGKVYEKNVPKRKRRKDDITKNSQIRAIKKNKIDDIQIVCKKPTSAEALRRAGYLLEEFEGQFRIRFFDSDKYPIPKMRGRIMFKENERVVVITKKIRKPSAYEYSEHPVSSLPGGLFEDLWEIIWKCSIEDNTILERCRDAYTSYVGKQKEPTS